LVVGLYLKFCLYHPQSYPLNAWRSNSEIVIKEVSGWDQVAVIIMKIEFSYSDVWG
jgi:hypothetical protein